MRSLRKTRIITLTAAAALTGICAFAQTGLFKYESHGKRDPFVSLVGPEKTASTRLEDVLSADEIRLEGIGMGARGARNAIVNGQILKVGDRVGEIEVKDISEKSVTLTIGGKAAQIDLPEQGGFKIEK